jgi:hypothetical protein
MPFSSAGLNAKSGGCTFSFKYPTANARYRSERSRKCAESKAFGLLNEKKDVASESLHRGECRFMRVTQGLGIRTPHLQVVRARRRRRYV